MRAFKVFISLSAALLALSVFNTHYLMAKEIATDEYWMGIYSGDKRVGYSYSTSNTNNSITKVFELTNLKINLLGKESDVYSEGSYILEGYKILSFEYEMNSDDVNLKARGTRKGNKLNITMETVSGKTEHSLTIKQELILPSLVSKLLVENNLKSGDKYKFILFEPLYLLMGIDEPLSTHTIGDKEILELAGNKFETYRVDSDFIGSEITSWINERGEVIKQKFPPGLTAVRESKEDILSGQNLSFDIVSQTSVSTNKRIKNPGSLIQMKVKLEGIDVDDAFDINDGYRQTLDGQILEIKNQPFISKDLSYDLPYDSQEYHQYTDADFLVQSTDKEIVSATMNVLDGETNPANASKKINDWIFKTLKKYPTASLPNAKDVLKTKIGDCNEHAILFTAMARAAGIPTKTVLGLMYIDGKFVYHAWNEVYLGSWIAVDSTFGQFPADATHIKLIEGNLARSAEISKVVGKLKIEIIEAS